MERIRGSRPVRRHTPATLRNQDKLGAVFVVAPAGWANRSGKRGEVRISRERLCVRMHSQPTGARCATMTVHKLSIGRGNDRTTRQASRLATPRYHYRQQPDKSLPEKYSERARRFFKNMWHAKMPSRERSGLFLSGRSADSDLGHIHRCSRVGNSEGTQEPQGSTGIHIWRCVESTEHQQSCFEQLSPKIDAEKHPIVQESGGLRIFRPTGNRRSTQLAIITESEENS
jgi:hypothetical protein